MIARAIALVACAAFAAPRAYAAADALSIYFIDTEGGQSTLYVSPTGESLLVDAGFPGGRDAERIVAAMADAGVRAIDYLVLTHYHLDHIGGLEPLAARVPIRHFIDHGPSVEPEPYPGFFSAYAALQARADHHVARAGERLPIRGFEALVVTSANRVLDRPLPGAGQANAHCAGFERHAEADDENAQSVGLLVSFAGFRAINLGDFTWNSEFNLMCPRDPIGGVDLYLTSHQSIGRSGSAALVHALRPQVVVVNNSARKGGVPQIMEILHASPGLHDLWQLHWSQNAGIEYNAAGRFIANLDSPAATAEAIAHPPVPRVRLPGVPGPPPATYDEVFAATGHAPAWWIQVTARRDGTFTVRNPRNGFSRTYDAGARQRRAAPR